MDLNTALDVLIAAGFDISFTPAGNDVQCSLASGTLSSYAVEDTVAAALVGALKDLAHKRGREEER